MNISAILIHTRPEWQDELIESFQDFSWLDVHISDQKGRIIATIEGESVDEEHQRASLVLETPKVLSVDMLNHYFDANEETELMNLGALTEAHPSLN